MDLGVDLLDKVGLEVNLVVALVDKKIWWVRWIRLIWWVIMLCLLVLSQMNWLIWWVWWWVRWVWFCLHLKLWSTSFWCRCRWSFSVIQINYIFYNNLQLKSLQSFIIIILVQKEKTFYTNHVLYDFLLKLHGCPVSN